MVRGDCVEFISEGPDSKMVGRLKARVFPTRTLKGMVFVTIPYQMYYPRTGGYLAADPFPAAVDLALRVAQPAQTEHAKVPDA